MPFAVRCGGCGKRFRVSDTQAGRRGKCPGCGSAIALVPEAAPAPAAARSDPRASEPDDVTPLTDTLTRLGLITAAQVERAMRVRAEQYPTLSVTEVLLKLGMIEPADLERARAAVPTAGEGAGALVGTVLGGCRLEQVLGQGGMGVVYRATELELERPVALKILLPALAADAEYARRFDREAKAAARLAHPGIAQVYKVGAEGGRRYLVQEYLPGGSLKARVEQAGPLPLGERFAILRQIAAALGAAHAAGIVHRDVKADNVLLAADGRAVLTDFGIARDLTANTQLTGSLGATLGSPAYMAPELWEGKPATPQTDLWALGVLGCYLATGQVPFPGSTPAAVMARVLGGRADLSAISDEGERAILGTLLAREPESRYQTIAELAADLATGRRSSGNEGDRTGAGRRTHHPATRSETRAGSDRASAGAIPARDKRRVAALAAAILVVVGVAATGIAGQLWYRGRVQAEEAAWSAVGALPVHDLDARQMAARAYLTQWGEGAHATEARRELEWADARRRAGSVDVDLDRQRPAREWEALLDALRPAASFGRDPALVARAAKVEERFQEATDFEELEHARQGTEPDAGANLTERFLQAHPTGIHRESVVRLHGELRAAVTERAWSSARSEAERARADGNHARAIDCIEQFRTSHSGSLQSAAAAALVDGWVREDWEATRREVAQLEHDNRFAEAAGACQRFLRLPHRGGRYKSEAESLATGMLSEDYGPLEEYLAVAAPFGRASKDSLWRMGRDAYRKAEFDEAVDCWLQLARDLSGADAERIHLCLKSCVVKAHDAAAAEALARRARQAGVRRVLALCERVESALPNWQRLRAIRAALSREDIPDSARMAIADAQQLAAEGQQIRALASYREARRLLADRADWTATIDEALQTVGEAVLETAVRAAEGSPEQAMWDADAETIETALGYIEAALSIQPAHPVLLRAQKRVRPIRDYSAAIRTARGHLAAGEWEQAASHARRALELRLGDLTASAICRDADAGRVAARVDQGYREALQRAREALAAGQWADARRAAGDALKLRSGDKAAKAIQRDAEAGEQRALVDRHYSSALEAARTALAKRQWDQARSMAEEALKHRPGDGEATRLLEEARAGRIEVYIDPGRAVRMEFVLVKAGTFEMGLSQSSWGSHDLARHTVTLTRDFWVQTTEVTQEQWTALLPSDAVEVRGDGRLPVVGVTWVDCHRFLKQLDTKLQGWVASLPTEAEWECACRAGSDSTWGDGVEVGRLGEWAWDAVNSGGERRPVASKRPNAWGIHDMLGNVAEWCSDRHGSFSSEAVTDPLGPPEGSGVARVVRGGSFLSAPEAATCFVRSSGHPLQSVARDVGFRVVLRKAP